MSFTNTFGSCEKQKPFFQKIGLTSIRAAVHHRCVSANGSPYDCRVRNSGENSPPHYHPVYSSGVCHRVVDVVEYRVTHNGTRGVLGVDLHFRHRDVLDVERPVYLDRKFSVRFIRVADAGRPEPAMVYERSGKPGYVTGNAVLTTTSPVKDTADRGRPKPMELPQPNEYGFCDANSGGRRRQSVNFLENVDVRCRVRIQKRRYKRAEETNAGPTSSQLCHAVQNEVRHSTEVMGQRRCELNFLLRMKYFKSLLAGFGT